jgi:single-stranded-DNA-specific exonuclease
MPSSSLTTPSTGKAASLHAFSPAFQRLLKARGYTEDNFQKLFSWDLKETIKITEILDLEKAAFRLLRAIEQKEKIAVYGDYDVDGTTSCALLWHFFQLLNVTVDVIQPSRFIEGYGLHISSIEEAHRRGIKVLVTVDCGITSAPAALAAKEVGIELIITDHHRDALDEWPEAYAIVNPNRRDEPLDSPLRALAGVGVAFALAVKIKEKVQELQGQSLPSLYPLLSFVAVGTICDLAPMTTLNLILCRHGIKVISQSPSLGLKLFFTEEDFKYGISPDKLSFQVGPLINSKGRMDHPERAFLLLVTNSREEARTHMTHLEWANQERKATQNKVFEEAKQLVLEHQLHHHPALVLYRPDWHEGVIGIVASKMVETFQLPTVILTDTEDKHFIKGSARSVGELNIFDCLKSCESWLVKFGGHKAAAGMTLKKDELISFREQFNQTVAQVPLALRQKSQDWDIEIERADITPQFVKELQTLAPFGIQNPRPKFRMQNISLQSYKILKEAHVKWTFQEKTLSDKRLTQIRPPLSGISFFYFSKLDSPTPDMIFQNQDQPLEIEFSLEINRFNGNENIQLQVDKVRLQ